ncbi:MAG: hypothetical protein V3575_06740 [Candidatus Absconditabacteria bacterium]
MAGCLGSNKFENTRDSNIKINPSTNTKKDLLDVPIIEEEPHEIQNYTIDGPISQ